MKNHIERMVRAMAWADRQILRALRSCPAAHADVLPLLAHVVAAEHIWLQRLRRQEARHVVWPALTLAECESLAGENAVHFAAFLERLREADLVSAVRYRNTRGEEFSTSLIDAVTHVVIHGAYHRGQIARVLGSAGASIANTDYITFARSVEPSPLRCRAS
jgi:uncharacterized damage-inducible protein DinB